MPVKRLSDHDIVIAWGERMSRARAHRIVDSYLWYGEDWERDAHESVDALIAVRPHPRRGTRGVRRHLRHAAAFAAFAVILLCLPWGVASAASFRPATAPVASYGPLELVSLQNDTTFNTVSMSVTVAPVPANATILVAIAQNESAIEITPHPFPWSLSDDLGGLYPLALWTPIAHTIHYVEVLALYVSYDLGAAAASRTIAIAWNESHEAVVATAVFTGLSPAVSSPYPFMDENGTHTFGGLDGCYGFSNGVWVIAGWTDMSLSLGYSGCGRIPMVLYSLYSVDNAGSDTRWSAGNNTTVLASYGMTDNYENLGVTATCIANNSTVPAAQNYEYSAQAADVGGGPIATAHAGLISVGFLTAFNTNATTGLAENTSSLGCSPVASMIVVASTDWTFLLLVILATVCTLMLAVVIRSSRR